MEGLISKPQFDANVFMPGTAFSVATRDRNEWYGFNYNCLVVEYAPLKLTVAHINKDGHLKTRCIPVGAVADGTLTIKFLVEKGE